MYGKEMRELESNQTFMVLYYIITIVNMLYRVFLWTDILLISTGYIILKSDFNKRDIKKHIIIIMSVSILMSFGMLTNNNFYIFSSYEITNLILYISSFIFVNFEGNKIIRILKRKLSFYIICPVMVKNKFRIKTFINYLHNVKTDGANAVGF